VTHAASGAGRVVHIAADAGHQAGYHVRGSAGSIRHLLSHLLKLRRKKT
jgi:hypothetical protein